MEEEQNCKVQKLPFALYDAFTATPYSGSQAGIVLNASGLQRSERVRIAQEIGAPATSFVECVEVGRVVLQFFSTVMELPMCGHGTICLVTRLVDVGLLDLPEKGARNIILDLPNGEAIVEYHRNEMSRVEVMLDVAVADFSSPDLDMKTLADLLGIQTADLSTELPVEVARGDFVHLCLPMRDLAAMKALAPDFSGLASFCVANGLETVAAFSNEVVNADRHLHVRDFCPAVGVAESAAAGTTNAALAAYALRHGLVQTNTEGVATVLAEQGIELGRPSKVTSRIEMHKEQILRLQVGGVATQVLEGTLNVAFAER